MPTPKKTKPAPKKKAAAPETPSLVAPEAAAPAKASAPGEIGFTAEQDELWARGFPHLRTLTDEAVPAKRAARQANKALHALDPHLPLEVPRTVATRYLHGYVFRPFKDTKLIEAAVEDEGAPIDEAWLAEVLEKKCAPTKSNKYGGETYDFRLAEVLFLFEAFLGSEVVVRAIILHLVAALEHPEWAGGPFWVDHHHQECRRLPDVVGWMRFRLSPEQWRLALAPLREALSRPHPAAPDYEARLRALADDSVASDDEVVAMHRRDPGPVRAFLAEEDPRWFDPQLFLVAGTERLLDINLKHAKQLPGWWKERLIVEFGALKAPGVARLIGSWLAAGKTTMPLAAAWIAEHAAWIEAEALPVLAQRKDELALVEAIRAAARAAAPV